MEEQKPKTLTIAAHPFVAAYLQKGVFGFQRKWFKAYKKWINIESKTALTLLDYEFLDKEGKEILF
jgi:ribonuclease G